MSKYYISSKDDELKHYGVKGMKWRHHKNKEEDDDEEFRKNMTTLGKAYFTSYDAFKSASNAAKNTGNFAGKNDNPSPSTNKKNKLHSRKRRYGVDKKWYGDQPRKEAKKATVKRRTKKILWWDTGIHVKAKGKRKKLPKDPKPNLHNNYQK